VRVKLQRKLRPHCAKAGLTVALQLSVMSRPCVLTQTTVTSVDVKANIAQTNKGQTLSFDHLVFATGSRNRQLPMEGAELGNVFGLRDLLTSPY